MKIKYLFLVWIVLLVSSSVYAQDSTAVPVDTTQLPVMSQMHYAGVVTAADRNYDYDIHKQASYYKTTGYTIAIGGSLCTVLACTLAGLAISSSLDVPDWAEIVIPISGLVVGIGAAIPVYIAGLRLIRQGNMLEQTAYLQVSDKVSVSASRYANLNDRMDKGGSVGLAVKL